MESVSISQAVTTLLERFTIVKHGSLAPVCVALALVLNMLKWLNVFGMLPMNREENGPGAHSDLSCY